MAATAVTAATVVAAATPVTDTNSGTASSTAATVAPAAEVVTQATAVTPDTAVSLPTFTSTFPSQTHTRSRASRFLQEAVTVALVDAAATVAQVVCKAVGQLQNSPVSQAHAATTVSTAATAITADRVPRRGYFLTTR